VQSDLTGAAFVSCVVFHRHWFVPEASIFLNHDPPRPHVCEPGGPALHRGDRDAPRWMPGVYAWLLGVFPDAPAPDSRRRNKCGRGNTTGE